jgi:hypothetical protein
LVRDSILPRRVRQRTALACASCGRDAWSRLRCNVGRHALSRAVPGAARAGGHLGTLVPRGHAPGSGRATPSTRYHVLRSRSHTALSKLDDDSHTSEHMHDGSAGAACAVPGASMGGALPCGQLSRRLVPRRGLLLLYLLAGRLRRRPPLGAALTLSLPVRHRPPPPCTRPAMVVRWWPS